jgi:hypothetical protein
MLRLYKCAAAVCFASLAFPLMAANITLEGVVISPQEQGDPFVLKMGTAKAFGGDPDCGKQQKAEIDLWDQASKLRPYVGKVVSVSGRLDCPRGGYVLRDVKIAVPGSSQPAVSANSGRPTVVRILSCFNYVGVAQQFDQYMYFSDGTFAETGWLNGHPVALFAGNYMQNGETYLRTRVSTINFMGGSNQWARMPVVVEISDKIRDISASEAQLTRNMVRNNGVDKTSEYLGKDGYVRRCQREEADSAQRQQAEAGRLAMPSALFRR